MPQQTLDDEDQQHDDLGVHPEQREAEAEDWRKRYDEPSAADELGHKEGLGRPVGDENLDKKPGKSSSPSDLKKAESGAAGGHSSEEPSLYHEEGGGRTRRQRLFSGALFGVGSAGSGKTSTMSSGKKKLLLGVGIGGGGGVVIVLAILLFIASSLKIPDLAQHITEYEFARVTRQFSQSAERVSDQDLAIEALNGGVGGDAKGTPYDALKDQYQNLRDNTWGKLDKYRPSKVIENLDGGNGLKLTTHNSLTGRTILDGVELDGTSYEIAQTSGWKRFFPALSQFDEFKNQVAFSRDFAPDLIESLRADDVGTIVRSLTANKVRQELGIGLIAWTIGKYQGKDPADAEEALDRQAYQDINEPNIDSTGVSPIDSAETDSANQIKQDVSSDSALKTIEANGGSDAAATKIIDNDVGQSALNGVASKILSWANPVYAVALPACIIYQGSLNSSGPTIDSQTAEQQRAYYFVATAADQQKYGTEPNDAPDGLATAVGATDTKVGDITQSNPEIRANGGTVDTSATALSAEASPTGNYTLFNAIPGIGDSGAVNTISSIATKACGPLTNVWVAAGVGVAFAVGQLVLDAFTGGGATAGDAAADTAINTTVDEVSQSFVSRFVEALSSKFEGTFTKQSDNYILKKVRDNLPTELKKVTGLVGLTVLAKIIVLSKSHQLYNGLEQGADFDNEADSGGNIQAGELERTMLFGRPMLENEVCQSNQEDTAYVTNQENQKSAYDRYLSTSDADSLLSRTATDVGGNLNGSIISSFLTLIGNLVNKPSSIFSSLTNLFNHKALAATNCADDTTDYGNVQFGWSQSEENLIDSNDSYTMMANQQILDNSHQESAIAQKYHACFGYKWNASGTSLDPTDPNSNLVLDDGVGGSASLGTLLASGAISRDSDGNVVNNSAALCSPDHLDPSNNEFGSQMVFRWRLAMQYDITLNQMTQEANVST